MSRSIPADPSSAIVAPTVRQDVLVNKRARATTRIAATGTSAKDSDQV
jgi:hypothetical protein